MIETRQINDIVNRIALNYDPDKIILFGSYAHGNYSDNSDLDFILVKDTNAPKNKRGMNYLAAELSRYQNKIILLSKQNFGELSPQRLEIRGT